MRVLYLIDSLGHGGAEYSISELLPRLSSLGIDGQVACFSEGPDSSYAANLRGSGIDVHVLGGGNPATKIRRVRSSIHRQRPDIVHTTLYTSDLVGRLAAIRTGVPVVTSLVSTPYDPARLEDPAVGRRKLQLARMIDGWTARHMTAHLHAITHAVKAAAERDLRIAPDRITVVERGRDFTRFPEPSESRRQTARTTLGLKEEHEVVINLGRHAFAKGHDTLVRAVAHEAPRRPHLVLLQAGHPGNRSAALDALVAERGLTDRVVFLGHRDDVPALLAAADVFAFPSLYEGLGGSLIEAMAAGLPIVASDIPAHREVLPPDGAVLVPPADPERLAQAISSVLDDPSEARRMGRRNREAALQRFDLDQCADRTAALYRSILDTAAR